MSVPQISVSPAAFDPEAEATLLVVPALPADEVLADWPGLAAALQAVEYTGTAGAFTRVALLELTDKPVGVVGLGTATGANAVRDAVGAGVRSFTGVDKLHVHVLGAEDGTAAAAAEGALLGGYTFDTYKTSGRTVRASEIVLHTDADVDVAAATAVATAVALVKDLGATPAEWQSPAQLAESAQSAVADLPVEVTVWDQDRLEAEGFGGILGVGRGSDRPSRLVRLDYAPAGAERHIALVGKGITFDTGGLSLKPAASMVGMKTDMIGAATALAVVQAAAQLKLSVHLTAWLCIADNMPSGRATRPGDVLRMHDGQTVEVLNTDAEGRLVLGDGLSIASSEHPDLIIDIATLTGAIVVALGNRHTGVFGDDEVTAQYLDAAQSAGEAAWGMPLPEFMESELDSPIADMKNANMGSRAAGSSFAGLFLRRFVGPVSDEEGADRIRWVHLDIAGSATNESAPFGYTDKGITGATVRSLIELVSR
ncbi:leucyl aminopeptidase [Microbacterium gorillae]|uniref:leucyl aminopeptidase n=1 Tax=Microbacterium gorillae TaxID=1231063 RepID=UPI00058B8A33|nr:leucyl aminopeptidase [Microbacterium gorillae]